MTVAAVAAPPTADAEFPYPTPSGAYSPDNLKVSPPTVPSNFSETGNWAYTGTPESAGSNPLTTKVNNQQDELCGVRGASIADNQATQPAGSCATGTVHTAWSVTTGRPDVVIDVLDSGILWNDQGEMTNLRNKVHLNQGELPAPRNDHLATPLEAGVDCSTYTHTPTGGDHNKNGDYDINGDGVFNLRDYACDSRVAAVMNGGNARHADRHGPAGFLTPEDLILAFSDGTDDDHNGYVDDIAGWNFVDDNNNPFDDVQYAHGTGEARDSSAEASAGPDVGTCPNCEVVPLRVGESFVADANRFAQAVLYATDNGSDIVQEALGTLNAPQFARQAIEYAYNHGVTVIASAADEAAEHHNQPGSQPDTIVVNSVTKYNSTFSSVPPSYLQFNGCTNFTTRLTVSIPSTSCSSDATGKGSGIAGLIYSAAENAVDAHKLSPSSDCTRVDGSACVITPNEVRQLMASGNIGSTAPADAGSGQADDVNFAGSELSCPAPLCTDPNKNSTPNADQNGGVVGPLPDTRRYPARKGFDEFYGYGRVNAYRAAKAAADGTIPPEADITSPDWFQQIDPGQSSFNVDGAVNARVAYTCKVEVAPGGQPNNATDFHQVSSNWCDGSTQRTSRFSGQLASVDVSTLKGLFPPGQPTSFTGNENGGLAQDSNGRPNTLPYAFTVRVVVTTAGGPTQMSGEDRRQFFLRRDADMLPHFPIETRSDGDSSPLLADLDGDNRNELVVANSDGVIHAYRSDGSELPGWPVHTSSLPLHPGARAYSSPDGVGTGHYAAVLGALAAGDLFHDGRLEVVADDNLGNVYAWDSDGHLVFHQTSNPAYSGTPLNQFQTIRAGVRDRTEAGFLASPVLANLDGRGLDIIAAGEDRHVYAWHADGSPVAGFPVLVADPDKVASVDPTTNHLTFKNVDPNPGLAEDQGKLIDTPAAADITGSGHPSIIVGSNEEYVTGTGDEGQINASAVNATTASGVGLTGQLTFANGRVYAIKSSGGSFGNAFLSGWPKKVGIIDAGLLPDVGEGVNGSPVVAPVTCPSGGSGMKIGVTPDAGPAYIFNADGSSCYGNANGQDTTLQTDVKASASDYDTPVFAAVGYPTFGTLDGATTALFTPVAGLIRALDLIAPEYQGGEDFIGGWNPNSGQMLPDYPAEVNDLQFLSGPAVGDIAGGPTNDQQVVGGSASLDLAAFNAAGTPASTSWPKLTGDWTVATPTLGSLGTLDTESNAKKDVVSITRSGTLSVYTTPAAACSPSSSPRFHHDIANSGDYTRDAVPPGRPMNVSYSRGLLSLTAPGNDLLCGTAHDYQLVSSRTPITVQNFGSAKPVAGAPAPTAAGTNEQFVLPAGTQRYVAIRAEDAAGNIGLPATIDLGRPVTGVPSSLSPGFPGFPPGFFVTTARGGCIATRRHRFDLPRHGQIVAAKLYVNGRLKYSYNGENLTAVTAKDLPQGRFSVRIVATTKQGRKLVIRRHYRGCRTKRGRHKHRHR